MKYTRLVPTLTLLGAGLCYAGPVLAYLDPGTGSIILQGLIAGIAGALVVGKLYWERIKQFFSRGNKERTVDSGPADEPQSNEAVGSVQGADQGGKDESAR